MIWKIWKKYIFQSTFPLQGTTNFKAACEERGIISIHVPIAGNDDFSAYPHFHAVVHFNPRSHCRERRRIVIEWLNSKRYFNPRSHCRERRKQGVFIWQGQYISIHVPIAGNDNGKYDFRMVQITFQSTFPLQGTTACMKYLQSY